MSIAEPPVAAPVEALGPRLHRVIRTVRETHDVVTLELETGDANGQAQPGQFNMLHVPGVGEAAISLSADPAAAGRLVHTVRALGSVSEALTRRRPGEVVGVRGPFGVGWPVTEIAGRDVVVIAGGIGLAPLRPIVHHVLAQRDCCARVAVLYGTRSPGDILYRAEVARWRGRLDVQVEVTVDSAPESWRGSVGVVTRLLPRVRFDPEDVVVMLCGPEVMMRVTAAALRDRGVVRERIWVSLERHMTCGAGFCGRCQLGPVLVCRDGPVFPLPRVERLLTVAEL